MLDYVTYVFVKEIFFRPRHIFFTYPDKSVRGWEGAWQAGAELGAGHGQQASHNVTCTQQNSFLDSLALIYFVQQRNMTKYIGSCIVANPLNLKACV